MQTNLGLSGVTLGIGFAIFSICSCSVSPTHDSEDGTIAQVTQALTTPYRRASEEPLLKIAEQIHEFAGYYCDAGNLVVLVSAPTSSDQIVQDSITGLVDPRTLDSCRSRGNPDHLPEIIFQPAQHSFLSLRSWRDSLTESFFDSPGAVSLGIDYPANRVSMTVKDADSKSVVQSWLSLPTDVYSIGVVSEPHLEAACVPPSPNQAVFSCFAPVPGGVVLRGTANGISVGAGASCTVGSANTRLIPGNPNFFQDGWVTNAHCVSPQWRMESNWVWQPGVGLGTQDPADFIGFEFVDPPGWTCGPRECRYSDAAWIWANPNSAVQVAERGKIARPFDPDAELGIDTNFPRFSVRDYRSSIVGMEVQKVGQTTGWTAGVIDSVCVDVSYTIEGRYIKLVCQDWATYQSDNGDSGSPVFFWHGDFETDRSNLAVDMLGIHWGTFPASGGGPDIKAFSPWDGVITDLGLIAVADPNFAAGSAVTSLSTIETSGWGKQKVVDSNRLSVTSTTMGFSSAHSIVNHTEWVVIQMPAAKTFSKVILYPRNDAGSVGKGFPIDFQIQVWNGLSWMTRVSRTNYPLPGDVGQVFTWGSSDTADRIRINATSLRSQPNGCCSLTYKLQFAEIEIY